MQQPLLPAHFSPNQLSLLSTVRPILLILAALMPVFGLKAHPMSEIGNEQMLADTTILATICSNETYIFDGDTLSTSGEYAATYVASDGSDSTVTLQLTVLPISETNVVAIICEGEEYPFNGANLSQSGEYTAVLEAANGCDSIVSLKLTVLEPTVTILNAGICAGSYYLFQGDTLTVGGVYSAILQSALGCDSIITLRLSVVDQFVVDQSVSICNGETYIFAGDTLKTALGGCDSLIVLQLNVLPNSGSTFTVIRCEGVPYVFFGDTLTIEGQYEEILPAANGCDSTIVLNLQYVSSFETSDAQTICDGDTYDFGSLELQTAGEYVQTFSAQGGCDSTVTLTLTVLPRTEGADQATICFGDAFEYQGEVLEDEGDYTFILQGANGCDSVVTFTLNVLPAIGTAFETTICDGDTYDFGDQMLEDAGVYEAIYTGENGCDSIVTLTLTVLPTQTTSLNASICAGDTYNYNGELLTDSGTYQFIYSGENGCDSTVILVLTVHPLQETKLEVSICSGESYLFNGEQLQDAGSYEAVFQDANGCDSTVTLVLSVLPVQQTEIEAVICDNESYSFNGTTLNTSGVYTAELTGENGCDSTVVLTLTVLPTQASEITAVICEGDVYSYFGIVLTAAGDYTFTFESENGCDSLVTVRLGVLPVSTTNLEATICDNEAYDFNGTLLTDEGVYTFEFDAANGCDSIVTIKLNVLQIPVTVIANSLCTGATFVYQEDTISVSGSYDYEFTGANGCDSIVTLVLEFVDEFETNLEVAICKGETFIFGTDTLADAGAYSLTLTAGGGCDSIVNLTLFVLPLTEGAQSVRICAGESFVFDGEVLTDSGVYTATLTGANGCDSIAVLTLLVLPVQTTMLDVTTCANEGYPFNGQILTNSGTYTTQLTGLNGCDSTIVLNLTVLPDYTETFQVAICANDTFTFEGGVFTEEGVYAVTYQGANGCDSTLVLELTVLPVAVSSFDVSVCDGESFEYNGVVLTESGVYEFVYPGQGLNGCDSVEVLQLAIFPAIPVTEISVAVCQGQSYVYNNSILTLPGTYTFNLSSATGCDSTVALTLSVISVTTTAITANICAGDSYPFNGQLLTTPGVYTATLEAASGCDSIVVLTLTQTIVNTNVTAQGNTLIAQATNATYQWINCANNQPIAGATGNAFTPAQTGNYAVAVTQNGCTAISNCTFVQVVSTSEVMAENNWSIQPNPAATFTKVVFYAPLTTEFNLEMYDLSGRLLLRQILAQGAVSADLDLNDLPNGTLVVRLSAAQGFAVKRLVKAGH